MNRAEAEELIERAIACLDSIDAPDADLELTGDDEPSIGSEDDRELDPADLGEPDDDTEHSAHGWFGPDQDAA